MAKRPDKPIGEATTPKPVPKPIDDGPQRPRFIGGHVCLMTDNEWAEHEAAINAAAAERKRKREAAAAEPMPSFAMAVDERGRFVWVREE